MSRITKKKVGLFVETHLKNDPCGGCAKLSMGTDDVGDFVYIKHEEGDEGSDQVRIIMKCNSCYGEKNLQVSKDAIREI